MKFNKLVGYALYVAAVPLAATPIVLIFRWAIFGLPVHDLANRVVATAMAAAACVIMGHGCVHGAS